MKSWFSNRFWDDMSVARNAVPTQLFDMKSLPLFFAALLAINAHAAPSTGNRLTYLDSDDPFYPRLGLARFTTPQWIGEEGVEAVVIVSIDDLRETAKYEAYLRPVLERLEQIDGRAPVSIMCNQSPPADPQFQAWLAEGLSLEVHTLAHPCPLLGNAGFSGAEQTYHGGVDLLAKIPGNHPVAFRMPCCDSMNSASPRFFAEIFSARSPEGHFLALDSSVMCLLTPKNASLPRELVTDADGQERFRKYFPMELVPPRKVIFDRFAGYIEDYPYPYVIDRTCWEFPCAVPSDWEAFNCHGAKNPKTLEDWKAELDAVVLQEGVMTFILHPHGWSDPAQIVDFVNHAVTKYGRRVKFLNFREALGRIEKNALGGQSLRAADGSANDVRLLDVNGDGLMDVVLKDGVTRVWNPAGRQWTEVRGPIDAKSGQSAFQGGKTALGVLTKEHTASVLAWANGPSVWQFTPDGWKHSAEFEKGLEFVLPRTAISGRSVILRDLDADGICELLVSQSGKTAIYQWSLDAARWELAKFALPEAVSIPDDRGEDNGLRFVDLNGDGFDDVLFSNAERYAIYLWAKSVKPGLGWTAGWSHLVREGARKGAANEPPVLVRNAPHRNNGAWFRDEHIVVQNEDTSKLEGVVERRSFKELIAFDVPLPKSPEQSLASIRVRPGFKVELVAAEPLVLDPIAFEWDARGRLWVVEMRDYPLGMDGKGKPGGVIKVLEDTDGDGRYDKATPFLEDVPFPTGVMPWRGGALIATAPDLIYAEDTNGDGRADVRRVLYSGFKEGNQQHRFNGFELGIDNWIYCANGDSGGTVKSLATGATVSISGHDFRFRPDSGEMQAIEGQTQYGRRCDDWGNWFGNNNPTWLWHYSIPERYLTRNPQVAVKSLKYQLANYDDPTRVFPVSLAPIRFNDPQAVNHVTSACSPTPYRDDLFGPGFETSVFISEPVHNVVHREVLTPEGVTFTSARADDERDREFLASTDNWFRPTMLKTGPDGALYIADIYRFVLEHPEWIAPETQERLDLRAGADKGRIYRVVPATQPTRAFKSLATLTPSALVGALDSANGWQRTTAQRLLVERGDKSVVPLLSALLTKSANPKARLQALWTLDALGALDAETLIGALADAHPAVREHAVRLAEPLLANPSAKLFDALSARADDSAIRVRYQLAFSLGATRDARAAKLLARIGTRDGEDAHVRTAVLSSAVVHAPAILEELLSTLDGPPPQKLVAELMRFTASGADLVRVGRVLARFANNDGASTQPWQMAAAAAFLDGLAERGQSIDKLQDSDRPEARQTVQAVLALVEKARTLAAVEQAISRPALSRVAVELLGRERSHRAADRAQLRQLLAARVPREVQSAALTTLARFGEKDTADVLLAGWSTYGPGSRQEIIALLLTRGEWASALLNAVEKGDVPPAEIGAVQRQALLGHADTAIRKKAGTLFTATNPDRQKIVQNYLRISELRGDVVKGRDIYRAQCAICHRLKGEGTELGPDLGMIAGKPLDQLLTAILDPNQAIEPRYLAYSATTNDGRMIAGIVSEETANGLTLKAPGGAEQVIARAELKELVGTGRSPMPEGLEQVLAPELMADLIAFLRSP